MDIKIIAIIVLVIVASVIAYYWFDIGYKRNQEPLVTITANPQVVEQVQEEDVATSTETEQDQEQATSSTQTVEEQTTPTQSQEEPVAQEAVQVEQSQTAFAYLAGGCFWCVEKDMEKLDATGDVISGYSGGTSPNPTYHNHSDHREAVMVPYDPSVMTYRELLHYFFRHHDGTDPGGSFYDRGHSYTSAIYYQTEEERVIAEQVKAELNELGIFEDQLVTAIEPFRDFTIAEDYHQNYYKRDPVSAQKYRVYRNASGRDDFINAVSLREQTLEQNNNEASMNAGDSGLVEITAEDTQTTSHKWASFVKPSDDVLKEELSTLEYKVTQKDGTEPPHTPGNLDDEKREGIFVDILSGEPLYSSIDKFDSGTGWPSFTKPIDMEFITTKTDYKLIYPRTEVRSRYGDNHLGHVFNDGPDIHNGQPSTGQRWCMNGVAMTFVPLEEMEEQGYGDYLYLFN